MFKLGLTGSIATGKSTALAAFAELGHPVFSADEAVHALYRGRGVAPVAAVFPSALRNKRIDRARLSQVLAKNPGRIKELEALVHPLVREEMAAFFAKAEASGARLAVAEVPLLFETGFDHAVDGVAVTICDEAQQRRRALERPGMDVEKLDIVLARQNGQDHKTARADYIIDTSGPQESSKARVKQITADILATAGPANT